MMNNERYTYILKSELENQGADFTDVSQFEYVLHVSRIEEKKELGFTDALFGRYNNHKDANLKTYRISIFSIVLNLCPRLKKATDFTRRISYAYDSMKLQVDNTGVVVKIDNINELKDNWSILKEMLKADYKGVTVDKYLKKIEDEIDRWSFMYSVHSYLIYGLLLPGVPTNHSTEWNRERQITLSRYDDEMLNERISYIKKNEKIRKYKVQGNLLEGSNLILDKFEGDFYIEDNNIFPVYSNVDIKYQNRGVTNNWKFNLNRY